MIERIFILIVTSFLTMSTCLAQARHDANWVFGKNAGLTFIDSVSNPVVFYSIANSSELNPCISDVTGNLLLFPRWDSLASFNSLIANLYNTNNSIIINGEDIRMDESSTNGGIILPIKQNRDTSYFLITTDFYRQNCTNTVCTRLNYSVIKKDSSENIFVYKKMYNYLLSLKKN